MLCSDVGRLAWVERWSLVWSELGRQHDTEKNTSERKMTLPLDCCLWGSGLLTSQCLDEYIKYDIRQQCHSAYSVRKICVCLL